MRVGLVLSGGGARGFAHIGVINVLEKHKIKISAVAGSSMGSVIGALYASGLSGKEIEKIVTKISWKEAVKILDITFSREGLIKGKRFTEFIGQHLKHKRFEELPIPLLINSTDIKTGEEIVFKKGEILRGIRASASFPGLMIPGRENGKILMDGGLVNPLASGLFDGLDIDFSIMVNVSTGFGGKINYEKPGMTDIFKISVNIMQEELIRLRLQQIKEDFILIRPDVTKANLFDISDISKLIKKGEIAGNKMIERVKKKVSTKT